MSGGSSYWGGYLNKNWVNTKINFEKAYLIKTVMIHQFPPSNYWTKDVSLQFANEMKFKATLNNIVGWNEITVPSNTISNYLNLTLDSEYGSDKWVGINEIKILGCRRGNISTNSNSSFDKSF